ncbi:MAG: hypothetical protein AAGM22_31775 [Acidobacteriota bacterium]
MEQRHLDRVHRLMTAAVLPESTKTSLLADLRDAALRGFHIDLEQLRANLERLSPDRVVYR